MYNDYVEYFMLVNGNGYVSFFVTTFNLQEST
jgi:hypothetical protein